MSRSINNDHLWTEEEVAYQKSRGRHREIETNKSLFGAGGSLQGKKDAVTLDPPQSDDNSSVSSLDKDIYDYVKGLTAEETADELKSRKLSLEGNVGDQKGRLAAALQKVRDADNS